jgi:hypothetical protein
MPPRRASENNLTRPYLDFDESRMCFLRVDGAARVTLKGLRPQGVKLLHYLRRRNRENGDVPAVCAVEELIGPILGDSRRGNPRADLARLVFDLRRVVESPGRPAILESVKGGGYRLITKAWTPRGGRTAFVCGPAVTHPAAFFGRARPLERIFNLWERDPFQHALLTGGKRSGKTSLLRYVQSIHGASGEELRPGQKSSWLPDASRYRFVFLDFQDPRLRDPQLLLRCIAAGLGLPQPPDANLAHFFDLLRDRLSEPAVILMDEIEAGLSVDSEFWAGLRMLGAGPRGVRLGFLITLQPGSAELIRQAPAVARFLDIFGHEIDLGPFERSEALELIQSSPIPFADDDVEWILRASRLYPGALQILCDSRLSGLQNGDADSTGWRDGAWRRVERFFPLIE